MSNLEEPTRGQGSRRCERESDRQPTGKIINKRRNTWEEIERKREGGKERRRKREKDKKKKKQRRE
jgi:hypothetical protein